MLAYQTIIFSPACFSDISAPSETQEAEHEIAYKSPTTLGIERSNLNIQETSQEINQTIVETTENPVQVSETLYSSLGDKADLIVDRLSTARRIALRMLLTMQVRE